MKKERIVHIIDNLRIGGAETLLINTIKKLPGYEHHIITLTPQVHFKNIEHLASVHCVHHTGWIKTIGTCSKIRRLIRQLNPSVIHAHLFLSSFLSRLASGHRYNFVYSIHNLYGATIFRNPRLRSMERWIYHPSQKLITVSNYVLQDYKKVVTKCKSGSILYDFINDSFLEPLLNKEIKDFPSRWISVGSLKDQKNYESMIICIEALNKAYPQKKVSLDIYGDGPLRSELQKRIHDLHFISLKGEANNISPILDQYDAYISTSKYEGYGIAPMEALARGLPVFLSKIPVYKEIYEGHAFLFSISEDVSKSFLECFQQYQKKTIVEKERGRLAGHHYAQKTGNGKNYISQLLAVYNAKVS
jgi:glycosyltransferase involved in cell wall biosynthesis